MRYRSWNVRLTFLLLLCTSLPALAQVNWPNAPAPCNDPQDLEGCILAQPGDAIIEINANAINGEQSLNVDQSVTLRPAPGFTPVFNEFQGWVFGNLNAVAPADVTVIIEGLTFRRLNFLAIQSDGNAAMSFEFRNNRVESLGNLSFRITGREEPSPENMNFIVEDNEFSNDDDQDIISVFSSWSSGNQGVIRNNRFDAFNLTQSTVIDIFGPRGQLTDISVDVIGNRIQGSNYNGGIWFNPREGGRLDARAINNVVTNQFGNVAGAGALTVFPLGDTALGDIWLINNTLVDNRRGIFIIDDDSPEVRTFLYNNIVAFSEEENYLIEEGSTVNNDFNLGFASGAPDEITPGPNFINADPQFVSIEDPSLQPGSPAINSGDSGQVPGDITLDIDGNPRIIGPSVDRGAYEFVRGDQILPESVPVPTLNAAGLIAMALLVLSLGLLFRPKT